MKAVITSEDYPRLRALLAKECLNFSEIGLRFGVTRERIRQIAKREGFQEGRERNKICALRTTEQRIQDELECIHGPVIAECAKRGLRIEPVKASEGVNVYRCSRRSVRVNGRLCAVQQGHIRKTGYHHVRLTTRDCDFSIVRFPNGWMVIPKQRSVKIVEFALDKTYPKMGAGGVRHDWPDFWEAWHLLKK